MEVISAHVIRKSFGCRSVLRGLDLSVDRGEVYGLLGNNGVGKSTAIKIITGLIESDGGSVAVDGRRPGPEIRSLIGVAPQEIALYPTLTCRENLWFFAGIYRLRGGSRRERVENVMHSLGIWEYADTLVSLLSGGWQRRLNLAVAMIHSPGILILDEPTAGMDIWARQHLWEFIDVLKSRGVSILITTHILEEAETLCDRIGILHEGQIAREGTAKELCNSIPAAELAEVEAEDESALLSRAETLGIQVQRYGGRLTLLLPVKMSLAELILSLDGVSVRSATLRPVGLSHVFLDVTQPECGLASSLDSE